MPDSKDAYSPLWDHVAALRQTLIRIFLFVSTGFVIAFCFHESLVDFLIQSINQPKIISHNGLVRQSLKRERIINRSSKELSFQQPDILHKIAPGGYIDIDVPAEENQLIILDPLEGMTTVFKICFWTGLILTAPFWGYCLLQFILPALKANERVLIVPFLSLSLLFLSCGFFFALYMTIPLANQFLMAFNANIGLNFWSLSQYMDYTLVLLLGHALAFELCLIILFLVHMRVIHTSQMIAWRRYVIVIAFIIGAIMTPPDVLSQVMLAIPLIILYEIAILYARFRAVRNYHRDIEITEKD